MTAARPSTVASKCGRMPSVQPTEAMKPARRPCTNPVETVKTTPVPGMRTTMSDVIKNSAVNMAMDLLVRPNAEFTGARILRVRWNVVLDLKLSARHQPMNAVLY
jgi:hypothetical protein